MALLPGLEWSRRQESNLYLPLRRRPFYPLNYGEGRAAHSKPSTRQARPPGPPNADPIALDLPAAHCPLAPHPREDGNQAEPSRLRREASPNPLQGGFRRGVSDGADTRERRLPTAGLDTSVHTSAGPASIRAHR